MFVLTQERRIPMRRFMASLFGPRQCQAGTPDSPKFRSMWGGSLFGGGQNVASGNCRVSGCSPRLTFPLPLLFSSVRCGRGSVAANAANVGVWADEPALRSANAALERAYVLSPAMRAIMDLARRDGKPELSAPWAATLGGVRRPRLTWRSQRCELFEDATRPARGDACHPQGFAPLYGGALECASPFCLLITLTSFLSIKNQICL